MWIPEDTTPDTLRCRDCGLQFIPYSCLDLYCDDCIDKRVASASRDARGDADEKAFCQH